MKKLLLITLLIGATFGLASCGNSEAPLTEAEQAEQYNMSVAEYKEMKTAAAKMNMTIEDHMKMMGGEGEMNMEGTHEMGDGSMMDDSMMSDDASMIEE